MKKLLLFLALIPVSQALGYTRYYPASQKSMCTDFGTGMAKRKCIKRPKIVRKRCVRWKDTAKKEDTKKYAAFEKNFTNAFTSKNVIEYIDKNCADIETQAAITDKSAPCIEYSKAKQISGSTEKLDVRGSKQYKYVCYTTPPKNYDYYTGSVYVQLTQKDKTQLADLLQYLYNLPKPLGDNSSIGDADATLQKIAYSNNNKLPGFKDQENLFDMPAYQILVDLMGMRLGKNNQPIVKPDMPCKVTIKKVEEKQAVLEELGIYPWAKLECKKEK